MWIGVHASQTVKNLKLNMVEKIVIFCAPGTGGILHDCPGKNVTGTPGWIFFKVDHV